MPRAKSLSHFPTEYMQIVRDCSISGQETRLRLVDEGGLSAKQRALKLRGHFYAFVGALRREAATLQKENPLAHPAEGGVLDLAKRVDGVALSLEQLPDGSVEMTWLNRENSWQAQLLRKASRVEGTEPPPPSGTDSMADRLLQLQNQLTVKGEKNG